MLVLYMNKSQKWMEIIKNFQILVKQGDVLIVDMKKTFEVIITDDGIGSVTFHCKDVIDIQLILMEEEFSNIIIEFICTK